MKYVQLCLLDTKNRKIICNDDSTESKFCNHAGVFNLYSRDHRGILYKDYMKIEVLSIKITWT